MLQLGRGFNLGGRAELDQARVATHLAQFEQGIQNGDLRFGQALAIQRFAHGFLHAQANGFVQVGLLAAELDPQQGFHFGG